MKQCVSVCWFLLVMLSGCLGQTLDDLAADENVVDSVISDTVASGTNAVATYLGFSCPAGYRCLPVLECLPCDYGSYKEDTSSKLCTPCPTGCTTLRKGASTWRECVPMCPPGYETSECGKTCVKCQPGYYKSTWLNEDCDICPADSNPDSVTLAMVAETQCYTDEEEPTCPETCTASEYSTQLHIPMVGSMCERFCHCENDLQSGTYQYTPKDCANGTFWVIGSQTCLTEDVYERSCVAEGILNDDTVGSGDQTSECKEICEAEVDEFTTDTIYRVVPNTGCERFCACGWYRNSDIYWQEIACTSGYMVDVNNDDYICRDIGVTCQDDTSSSESDYSSDYDSSYDSDYDASSSSDYTSSDHSDYTTTTSDYTTTTSDYTATTSGDTITTSGGTTFDYTTTYYATSQDYYDYSSNDYTDTAKPSCPAICTEADYANGLIPLIGSTCDKYCQCENDLDGGFKYTEQTCADNTFWIIGETACQNEDNFLRSCTAEGLVNNQTVGSGDQNSDCINICDSIPDFQNPTVYEVIPGTDCQQFCACGEYFGDVYWQEITCDDGYQVDENQGHICTDTLNSCDYCK